METDKVAEVVKKDGTSYKKTLRLFQCPFCKTVELV